MYYNVCILISEEIKFEPNNAYRLDTIIVLFGNSNAVSSKLYLQTTSITHSLFEKTDM